MVQILRTALFAIAVCPTAHFLAADWPMLGHDIARSGATPDGLRPPFERKWYRLFTDEGLMSGVQPVVADGKVFVGTLRGKLHAIDAETGTDVWSSSAGGVILHTSAVAGGKVFFGCADGSVHAVGAANGLLAWKCETRGAKGQPFCRFPAPWRNR